MSRRYADNIASGRQAQLDAAESYLDGKSDKPVSRELAPFDFYFKMAGIQRADGGADEDRRDLWKRLAFRLTTLQNPDGTWGKGKHVSSVYPSSIWAWKHALARRNHEKAQEKLPADQQTPYNSQDSLGPVAWAQDGASRQYAQYPYYDTTIARTAYAMLFLADGVRPPMTGYVTGKDEGARPKSLSFVTDYVRKQHGVAVSSARIDKDSAVSDVMGLPVLYVTEQSDLSDARLCAVIREYLGENGTMIAEAETAAGLRTLEAKLTGLTRGGRVSSLAADSSFLADFKGKQPALRGIFDGKSRMVALLLPLPGQPEALTTSDAVQAAYLLIKKRLPIDFLDSEYPSRIEEGLDPFVARIAALLDLKGSVAAEMMPDVKKKPPAQGEATTGGGEAGAKPWEDSGERQADELF